MFRGSRDSPMWKRGWRSFSAITTFQPRSASSAAIVEPPGPPPSTKTSQSEVVSGIGPGIRRDVGSLTSPDFTMARVRTELGSAYGWLTPSSFARLLSFNRFGARSIACDHFTLMRDPIAMHDAGLRIWRSITSDAYCPAHEQPEENT